MAQELVSVVVPLHDESGNLRELSHRIGGALGQLENIDFEILLVDDGSADASWDVIRQLHDADPRIKGLRLSRNFGHQAALTAGFDFASGDAIITMDADLQHPPELLGSMIDKWRSGFHIVSMVRVPSPDEPWMKRRTSSLFYRLINALSEIKIKGAVADFRLLDRRVVRRLNKMRERTRFIRGMISWIGFRETEIHYQPAPRFAGRSQYSVRKMLHLAVNAISSFSTTPLTLGFYLGLAANAVCLGLFGYAVYNKIYENKDLSEWASTFMTMLFLNGIQLIMLSVLGLYLGRVLEEVKRRPLYITRDALGVAFRARRSSRGAHVQSVSAR